MMFENCIVSTMQKYAHNVVGEEVGQEKFQGRGQVNIKTKKKINFILGGTKSKDKVKMKAQ